MSFSKHLVQQILKPDLDSLRFGLATTVAFSAIGKVHIATVQALPISILPWHPAGWCLRWFKCVGKTCFHQPFSFFNTIWNMFEFREIEDAIVFSNESFLNCNQTSLQKTGWNKKHFISTFPPPHPLGETLQHPRLQWVPFVSAAYWPHNDCRKDEFRSSPQTAKSMEKHMFFHVCFHEKYWLKCPQRSQTFWILFGTFWNHSWWLTVEKNPLFNIQLFPKTLTSFTWTWWFPKPVSSPLCRGHQPLV